MKTNHYQVNPVRIFFILFTVLSLAFGVMAYFLK